MQRDSYDTWWEETRYLRPLCLMRMHCIFHIRGAALNALADLELGGPSHRDTSPLELCTKLRMRDFRTVQNRLFIYGPEGGTCLHPPRSPLHFYHNLQTPPMTSVTTTAVHKETPLRKRLHVLERTQLSTLNLRSPESKAPPLLDTKLTNDDVVDSHFAEYAESPSDLSDDELSPGGVEAHHASEEGRQKPKRPTLDTGDHGHHHHSSMKHSPMSPTSRAWYEFDLAVVVALVSPIGNWLTGTDHVKNILLIVLLIFYLHQIIESERLHYSPRCIDLTTYFSSLVTLPKIPTS